MTALEGSALGSRNPSAGRPISMIISYSTTTSYIEPKFAQEPILGVNGTF
jgi:hypothetical protein